MPRKAGSAICLAMMITAHLLTRAWPHGHLLASGSFHQVTHKGSGEARIYRLSDASLLLAIRSFRTAYVPDLEVLLVANTDAPNNATVLQSRRVHLGRIAAAISTWSATLPPTLDLNLFRAVTIWSPKYQVNFTTAPLSFVEASGKRIVLE